MELIKKCLLSVCHIDERMVVPEAIIIHDLGLDSLGVIDFVMAVEDESGIDIPDEVIDTLGNLQKFLRNPGSFFREKSKRDEAKSPILFPGFEKDSRSVISVQSTKEQILTSGDPLITGKITSFPG